MKTLVWLFFICTIALSCKEVDKKEVEKADETNAQEKTIDSAALKKSEEQEQIIDIKVDYLDIVKARDNGELQENVVRYNCNNEKRGTLHFYTKDGSLKLIEHVYNEYDHHEARDQYFVKDSMPFFIYFERKDWSFVEGSADEPATKDKITEERYYLNAGNILQCLSKQYETVSDADDNPRSEDIANTNIDCPNGDELLTQYTILAKHVDDKRNIGCLE